MKKLYKFLFILFCFFLLSLPASKHIAYAQTYAAPMPQKATSAALAANANDVTLDRRVKVLEEFLTKYDSPLTPNAQTFVRAADAYGLDWRLVAAISGVESTFGHKIPQNSYNAWGWGIYGDNTKGFASFDEAIEVISRGLKEDYINRMGSDNVYVIGKRYAASPTWAQRVEHFMNSITRYQLKNPDNTLSLSI